jgi:CubicO group peptidase (beta-lactamase class C family)
MCEHPAASHLRRDNLQRHLSIMRILTALLLMAITAPPLAAQGHFPSDSAIRALTRPVVRVDGNIAIVIGLLEADGTRRVLTVGDAPFDANTLFEIGSITKVFTGILLAEMAERGEVTLEQPVAELLPEDVTVPARNGREIRLIDLSTHSSGLPRMPDNFTPADWANPYADYDAAKMYEFLGSYQLPRDIGASFEYSNLGVGLLGHSLARRGGLSYEELVTQRVLAPLGMTSTKIRLAMSDSARLARGHSATGQQVHNWDINALAGAGALRSSAHDMLTFLAANISPPATSLGRAIKRSHMKRFSSSESNATALNWGIAEMRSGVRIIWHNGGTAGYRTFAGFDPDRRIAVVVLGNRGDAAAVDRIGMHLLNPSRPLSLAGLQQAFRNLAIALAVLFVVGIVVAWRRTGATLRRTIIAGIVASVCTALWMFATNAIASLGLLSFPPQPPTMIVLFVFILLISIGLGVTSAGRRLAAGLPLAVLVGVQGFRLPLELAMHRAHEHGIMPVQMSYSGLNFDILTGILAILIALLLMTGRAGLRAVRLWNLLGSLLLLNVLVIAFLSAPTPFRVFRNDPPNIWITQPPYVWLPAVMVALAILGHVVVFRRLRTEARQNWTETAQGSKLQQQPVQV